MTEQEIEKLREKLGSDYSVKRLNGAITVELVDIWDGVEFAECIESVYGYTKGNIYPVTGIALSVGLCYVDTLFDDKGNRDNGLVQRYAKPSTESAYVEQLKAKAKELYGEIKDGDRFDSRHLRDGLSGSDELHEVEQWYYEKETDTLYSAPEYCGGFIIYREGKWAKKVDRVNVEVTNLSSSRQAYSLCRFYNIQFKTSDISKPYNLSDISSHLSKCLEDYLNKIP